MRSVIAFIATGLGVAIFSTIVNIFDQEAMCRLFMGLVIILSAHHYLWLPDENRIPNKTRSIIAVLASLIGSGTIVYLFLVEGWSGDEFMQAPCMISAVGVCLLISIYWLSMNIYQERQLGND